jgi:hypothetical protein
MNHHRLLFVLAVLAFLVPANASFAQNASINQTLMQSAFINARCKTNFTVTYLGYITSAAPSLSSLGQYSTALQSDTSMLSSLASAGNITAFRNYVSGTFDPELKTIANNVSSAVRAANLSSNVISGLRQNYNATLASYKTCNINSIKQYALHKLEMFNGSIKSYQNQANNMASKGLNTSSLNQMLANAQSQIVNPFASAINAASNNSQISAALNEYCLFDGCKNGTNFHLAAHFSLQALTLQLNYLESEKNVSSSSLAGASADLDNASSILLSVGTKAYANGQADNIFDNLTAASKAMQQARQQDSFAKLKQNAEKIVGNYQKLIAGYQTSIGKLPSGFNTTQLNMTLSQADTQVVGPLQAALNSSTNATQLYSAFRSRCLENSCANGTNYHIAANLKLEESQAYLAYLELKANASKYVTVNQIALAAAEGDINNASSIISLTGSAQFSQSQATQLANYFSNFTIALKSAFTTSRSKLTAVNKVSVAARIGNRTVGPNAVNGVKGSNAPYPIAPRPPITTSLPKVGSISSNQGGAVNASAGHTPPPIGGSLNPGNVTNAPKVTAPTVVGGSTGGK